MSKVLERVVRKLTPGRAIVTEGFPPLSCYVCTEEIEEGFWVEVLGEDLVPVCKKCLEGE